MTLQFWRFRNPAQTKSCLTKRLSLVALCIVVIASIIATPSRADARNKEFGVIGGLVTIGSLLGLMGYVDDKIESLDAKFQQEARVLRIEIDNWRRVLQDQFQANLDVSIEKLEGAIGRAIRDFARQLTLFLEQVERVVDKIVDAFRQQIREITATIRQLLADLRKSLEDTIVMATLSGVMLIDRFWMNALAVAGAILALVAVLVLATMLYKTRGRPGSLSLWQVAAMALCACAIAASGAVVAMPGVRAALFRNLPGATKAEIESFRQPFLSFASPETINLAEQQTVRLFGGNLPLDGSRFRVTLEGLPLITAFASATQLSVKLPITISLPSRALRMEVQHPHMSATLAADIFVLVPAPDLRIERSRVETKDGRVVLGDEARITFEVKNAGTLTSPTSTVRWFPSSTSDKEFIDTPVQEIGPGKAIAPVSSAPWIYRGAAVNEHVARVVVAAKGDSDMSNNEQTLRFPLIQPTPRPPIWALTGETQRIAGIWSRRNSQGRPGGSVEFEILCPGNAAATQIESIVAAPVGQGRTIRSLQMTCRRLGASSGLPEGSNSLTQRLGWSGGGINSNNSGDSVVALCSPASPWLSGVRIQREDNISGSQLTGYVIDCAGFNPATMAPGFHRVGPAQGSYAQQLSCPDRFVVSGVFGTARLRLDQTVDLFHSIGLVCQRVGTS